MSELTFCPSCHLTIHRDDRPSHDARCDALKQPKPVLPVGLWVVFLTGGQVHIVTFGPSLVVGPVFHDAEYARTDLLRALEYLRVQVEGQP